jgi:hypothetical protein
MYTRLIDEIINFVGDDVFKIYAAANEAINAKVLYLTNKTDLNELINKVSLKLDALSSKFGNVDGAEMLNILKKFQSITNENILDSIVRVSEADSK